MQLVGRHITVVTPRALKAESHWEEAEMIIREAIRSFGHEKHCLSGEQLFSSSQNQGDSKAECRSRSKAVGC